MKEIPLTQGKAALVDDSDWSWLNQWKWHAKKQVRKNRTTWYAIRKETVAPNVQRTVWMHREILAISSDADHRDGDTLNNQRANLRPATCRQNQQNQHKAPGFTSRFKGVCWSRRKQRWIAQIRLDDKNRYLGSFGEELQAALVYDSAARSGFGEFVLANGVFKAE